jgi:transcriptional regulator with XRE-family HTH domain
MRTFNLLSSEAVCAELGARIKRLRLMRNLTQQEVADMTLASLSSIRRLESHGQGSLLLLVRVANAVQVVDQFDSFFNEPYKPLRKQNVKKPCRYVSVLACHARQDKSEIQKP